MPRKERAECPKCFGRKTYRTGNIFGGRCRITGKKKKLAIEYLCHDCGEHFRIPEWSRPK